MTVSYVTTSTVTSLKTIDLSGPFLTNYCVSGVTYDAPLAYFGGVDTAVAKIYACVVNKKCSWCV
jgi:hypothetical protein